MTRGQTIAPLNEDAEARFWAKVDKRGGARGCWEWTGARYPLGYGEFRVGPVGMRLAHRVAWTLTRGPLPEGLHVCHTCDNPPCVNPAHLFLGTDLDNARDKQSKGRQARQAGESNPRALLTSEAAQSIRDRHATGESAVSIARDFPSVSYSAVSDVVLRRSWSDPK